MGNILRAYGGVPMASSIYRQLVEGGVEVHSLCFIREDLESYYIKKNGGQILIQLLNVDLCRFWKVRCIRVCMMLNTMVAIYCFGNVVEGKNFMAAGGFLRGMSGISALTQSLEWSTVISVFTTIAIVLYIASGVADKTQRFPITKGIAAWIYISVG